MNQEAIQGVIDAAVSLVKMADLMGTNLRGSVYNLRSALSVYLSVYVAEAEARLTQAEKEVAATTLRKQERCAACGWTGTEIAKAHSGLSGLKGPGVCPDCGAEDFEESPCQP